MKRSLIFLAGKTGVVSLPASWIRKQGLSKGDELDLFEKDNIIQIVNIAKKVSNKVEVNVTDLSQSMIFRYINTWYKLGVSEIKIYFENQEKDGKFLIDIIQQGIDSLIGLEIVRQTKNTCIVKEISQVKSEEFSAIFRRMFLTLLSMTEDSLKAIKSKDKESLINISKYSDNNLNRLYMFCVRILNKENDYVKACMGNMTKLNALEKIGDYCAEINSQLLDVESFSLDERTLELYGETNGLLKEYYELHYKSTREKIDALIVKAKKSRLKIMKLSSSLGGLDVSVLSTLKIINKEIREIIDWIMV
jgi:phosphate uptake regulator